MRYFNYITEEEERMDATRGVLHFQLVDFAGPTLATRRRAGQCVEDLRRLAQPDVDIVLDFAGVEIATAPFLFELLAGVRELLRERQDAGAPIVIVANLEPEVLEELELVLDRRKTPLAMLRDSRVELVQAPPHLADTLREALEFPAHFTAPQLAERLSLEGTAINERLSKLVEGGVLSRDRDPSAPRGIRHRYRAPKPDVLTPT